MTADYLAQRALILPKQPRVLVMAVQFSSREIEPENSHIKTNQGVTEKTMQIDQKLLRFNLV